jgi:hypothetical protein
LDFDSRSQETPRLPHPCALCAQEPALSLPKGWDTPKPAAHAFEVDVARVERTLLSAAFDVDLDFDLASPTRHRSGKHDREGHDVQSCRKPKPPWKSGASAPR